MHYFQVTNFGNGCFDWSKITEDDFAGTPLAGTVYSEYSLATPNKCYVDPPKFPNFLFAEPDSISQAVRRYCTYLVADAADRGLIDRAFAGTVIEDMVSSRLSIDAVSVTHGNHPLLSSEAARFSALDTLAMYDAKHNLLLINTDNLTSADMFSDNLKFAGLMIHELRHLYQHDRWPKTYLQDLEADAYVTGFSYTLAMSNALGNADRWKELSVRREKNRSEAFSLLSSGLETFLQRPLSAEFSNWLGQKCYSEADEGEIAAWYKLSGDANYSAQVTRIKEAKVNDMVFSYFMQQSMSFLQLPRDVVFDNIRKAMQSAPEGVVPDFDPAGSLKTIEGVLDTMMYRFLYYMFYDPSHAENYFRNELYPVFYKALSKRTEAM